MGHTEFGIDPQVMQRLANEIRDIVQLGIQLGLVIGGGNIFRGAGLTANGIDRVTGDYMGMLATVMNALALQDALQKNQVEARVMSAIRIDAVCEDYTRRRAISHLEKGRIVIFAAGTGNPFFTTDTAASLRAIEIGSELMIKATKVDGVYAADPIQNPAAKRFSRLTYQEVLEQQLGVMDQTAIVLCRDHQMPLRVLNLGHPGVLIRTMTGHEEGTLIYSL